MRRQLRIKPTINRYLVTYAGENGLIGRSTTWGRSVNKVDIVKVEEKLSKAQGKRCIITNISKL